MKNLWFAGAARCVPEQNRADHKRSRDIATRRATVTGEHSDIGAASSVQP
ncbi:hypothetical protein [Burkholderia contaminans]|nr:hypothetical protein [Burkholderia contaminans]